MALRTVMPRNVLMHGATTPAEVEGQQSRLQISGGLCNFQRGREWKGLQCLQVVARSGESIDMEACFSQLTLDVIGKAVFNYDFDALTMSSPVIQVLQQPQCNHAPMACRTVASAVLQGAFTSTIPCACVQSHGIFEEESIEHGQSPALA